MKLRRNHIEYAFLYNENAVMLPVITLVGRPNVGKSSLFNYLTRTRDALVVNVPGVTRDRQFGEGRVGDQPYWVVDTGGLALPDDPVMAQITDFQVQVAIDEADCIFFLLDAKDGITSADISIAEVLRKSYADKIKVLVNKADREDVTSILAECYQLGLGPADAIATSNGRGIESLMAKTLAEFDPREVDELPDDPGIPIAIIGRPNVGKSTLTNRMLGEERVAVLDRPGTTRDSIYIPYERRGHRYTLIDTAGVRRKSKVNETVEKFSIVKTLQAMKEAHVVIVVINAQEGLVEQDIKLIGRVIALGRGLIIAINKWDGLDDYQREMVEKAVDRQLVFATFARRYYISALHGTAVGQLYTAIDEANDSASQELSTSALTAALEKAIIMHQPPLAKGRRIKLRYAHLGDRHPLVIVIHGKQTKALPESYKRYLAGFFRDYFSIKGIPVSIVLKDDYNPYINGEKSE